MDSFRTRRTTVWCVAFLCAILVGCAGEPAKSPPAKSSSKNASAKNGAAKKSPAAKIAATPKTSLISPGKKPAVKQPAAKTTSPTPTATKQTPTPRPKMAAKSPTAPTPAAAAKMPSGADTSPGAKAAIRSEAAATASPPELPKLAYSADLPDATPLPDLPKPGDVVAMRKEASTPSSGQTTCPPTDGYKVVKVFYGTDRAIAVPPDQGPWAAFPWIELTLASLGVSFVAGLVWLVSGKGRTAGGVTLLAVLATAALGAAAYKIPHNTKPLWLEPLLTYGNDRGELALGTCEVSIPENHQVGELEGTSILRFDFREDPTRHVVLMKVECCDGDVFYDSLRERVAQSEKKEAFVFVHGFNVTFENAARRTAQLAHDLNFDGAPILFSWPSQGGLLDYAIDETNVVWTVPHLKEFLLNVAEKTGAQRVHLIAHSMGNRALTSALTSLATELKEDRMPLFQELVLTAPDIDAAIFRRDIAPVITKTARHVTLYASSSDEALMVSKKLHGYPRAGESGENVVVVPGIDTVDVSGLDTSFLGHSYFSSNDTVLADLIQLLRESKPAELRTRLKAIVLGRLTYWVFLAENLKLSSHPEL